MRLIHGCLFPQIWINMVIHWCLCTMFSTQMAIPTYCFWSELVTGRGSASWCEQHSAPATRAHRRSSGAAERHKGVTSCCWWTFKVVPRYLGLPLTRPTANWNLLGEAKPTNWGGSTLFYPQIRSIREESRWPWTKIGLLYIFGATTHIHGWNHPYHASFALFLRLPTLSLP
jgi:hypothetical protein